MWNRNISEAPKSHIEVITDKAGRKSERVKIVRVWLATDQGEVIQSYWVLPEGKSPGRWAGLATKQVPLAWHPFHKPEHPDVSL